MNRSVSKIVWVLLWMGGFLPSVDAQWSITARAGFDFADQTSERFIDEQKKVWWDNVNSGVLMNYSVGARLDFTGRSSMEINLGVLNNIFGGNLNYFSFPVLKPNYYDERFQYFVEEKGIVNKVYIDFGYNFVLWKSLRFGFLAGINHNRFTRFVEYTARNSNTSNLEILERVGFEKFYESIWVPRVGASLGYDIPVMGRLSVAPEVQFFYDFMPDQLTPTGIDPAPEHIASLPGFQEVASSGRVWDYEKKFFFFNVVLRYRL